MKNKVNKEKEKSQICVISLFVPTSTACRCISSMQSNVYHQHKVLYLIKPRRIHLRWWYTRWCVMIYQACGLDKQRKQVDDLLPLLVDPMRIELTTPAMRMQYSPGWATGPRGNAQALQWYICCRRCDIRLGTCHSERSEESLLFKILRFRSGWQGYW